MVKVRYSAQVLFAFLILTASVFSWAQEVSVTATVDRNQVAPGETLTYTITISSQGDVSAEAPRLGDLEGLDLINTWSSQAVSSTYSNGTFGVRKAKTFNFMLAPKVPGKITIPAAQVVVDGKNYATDPIALTISNDTALAQRPRGQQPDPQADMMDQMDQMEDVFNQLLQRRFGGPPPGDTAPGGNPKSIDDVGPINPNEAFFLRAEADKTTAYENEQVTASWYLYTRGTITEIDTTKYPTLKGFWKEELDMATRLNFESVIINGMAYQRALLVSYALFPIKSGKASIDSYTAKCTVLTRGNFGFGRPYQYSKTSKPLELNVLEVPKTNRPKDFTGAVGEFKLSAEIDRTTTPAHQPVTWKIKIAGRGNAKLIDLPAFDLPAGVELYDQKSDSKFFKDGTSYKEFEVLLIPRQEGVVEIPSLSVSVFNPKKKTFEQVSTTPIKLTVTPGSKAGGIPELADQGTKPNPKAAKTELPFFTQPESSESKAFAGSLPLLGILFGISLASILAHAFLALGRTKKKETLSKLLALRTKKIQSLLQKNDWRKASAEMSNCGYNILSKVADQSVQDRDLKGLLRAVPPSLRQEHGDALIQLFADIETLAFAPEEIAKSKATPENLKALSQEFQRLMKESIQRVDDAV